MVGRGMAKGTAALLKFVNLATPTRWCQDNALVVPTPAPPSTPHHHHHRHPPTTTMPAIHHHLQPVPTHPLVPHLLGCHLLPTPAAHTTFALAALPACPRCQPFPTVSHRCLLQFFCGHHCPYRHRMTCGSAACHGTARIERCLCCCVPAFLAKEQRGCCAALACL